MRLRLNDSQVSDLDYAMRGVAIGLVNKGIPRALEDELRAEAWRAVLEQIAAGYYDPRRGPLKPWAQKVAGRALGAFLARARSPVTLSKEQAQGGWRIDPQVAVPFEPRPGAASWAVDGRTPERAAIAAEDGRARVALEEKIRATVRRCLDRFDPRDRAEVIAMFALEPGARVSLTPDGRVARVRRPERLRKAVAALPEVVALRREIVALGEE